jgi:predicted metal-dependent phosphoesterase TrpH
MSRLGRLSLLIVTIAWLFPAGASFAREGFWAKGNTHAHTNISDGDASPADVVKWYRDHGYQFLVLSDHDRMAPADFFEQQSDANFILIPGIELSLNRKRGSASIHMNAIGVKSPLHAIRKSDAAEALTTNMEMIRQAGAVVQINHPSFHLTDRAAVTKVSGTFLMETYNYSSRSDEMASIHQPIFESAWDTALTAGKKAYGVAADDTHDYRVFGEKHANPGGAWVMVRVASLTQEEILKNLMAGNFYSSTGVEIDQYQVDARDIRISVKPVEGLKYTIWFIGRGGMPLNKVSGTRAEYHIRGSPQESYVRVRIDASNDTKAWLQPVWPAEANRRVN